MQDATVVIVRDIADDDRPVLRDLAAASVVYAGDMALGNDEGLVTVVAPADGMRLAEDDAGPIGMYSLLARRGATGVEVELTCMLVAARAREWAVDRLLVLDMRQQAARSGAHGITVLTRPPMDVFFRKFGARVVGLAAPWGDVGAPRLRMELPV